MDSDRFVHWLEEHGAIVVTPSRKTAKRPRDVDRHAYMERHLVKNLFLKFKVHRRFATLMMGTISAPQKIKIHISL